MRHDARMVAKINDILKMPDQLNAICKLKAEIFDFCSSCWPKDIGSRAMALHRYSALFRHVNDRVDAEMTVGNLAEFLHWRRDTFSRNFSRDVGKSPKNFLQDALLKKVMVGLLTRQSSVKDIAEKYHFSSEFYFSRFFKRLTGISPSEYQKKFRQ
jgi:AraC-like DNA-binding protein